MNDISMEYFYLSQSDIDTGIGMGTRYQKTYMDITKTLDEYAELYRQFVFKYGYYMFTTYEHARLTILSVIGKGAFGTVYIVRIFDSVYALKMEICNTTIYTDETFRAKIKKEYFLQKGLAHEEYSYRPYEYGVVQDPSMLFSYLLMEVGDFAVRPFGDYWKSVPADQFSPLFMTQLRAILRAGVHGQALILYPMIASLDEVRTANRLLAEAKEALRAEGVAYDPNMKSGIMVEVPSAAVTADLLIRETDFFSIGSNDLTQYTLAVDRLNEKISSLYNPFQPGVLRLIRTAIDAAHRAGNGKFTGMCGEMAADPTGALLLLGLGLSEFSVNPSELLKVKKIITSVSRAYAQEAANQAMQLGTADEVHEFLKAAIPAELQVYL